jgi:hypothetical protein
MEIPGKISEIARLISADWPRVYFGAVPYLEAMYSLETINDRFGEDSARVIILYFLSNANTWRGETAKAVKSKLKELMSENFR